MGRFRFGEKSSLAASNWLNNSPPSSFRGVSHPSAGPRAGWRPVLWREACGGCNFNFAAGAGGREPPDAAAAAFRDADLVIGFFFIPPDRVTWRGGRAPSPTPKRPVLPVSLAVAAFPLFISLLLSSSVCPPGPGQAAEKLALQVRAAADRLQRPQQTKSVSSFKANS